MTKASRLRWFARPLAAGSDDQLFTNDDGRVAPLTDADTPTLRRAPRRLAFDGPGSAPMSRAFDITVSFAALLVLSPLMAVLAIWIRLDSPGPVLFAQRRVGRGQEVFRILKFRTMVHRDADSIDQVAERVVTHGKDHRISRIGRVLRVTSLDELPQLINVLRGDMSLVGPRPVLEAQVQAMPAEHLNRFAVRPGITGLAQVRGRRGLGWLEQLAADSEYVESHTFLGDVRIMFRTVKTLTSRSSVYADASKNWRAYLPDLEAPLQGTEAAQ